MAGRIASRIGRAVLLRRRGLLRDQDGTTAIEFGILALPFFLILTAIMETAIVFLSGQMLDSAVQDVSRLIRTGQAQTVNMTAAQFKAKVCDQLLGLFTDCNALHVEVEVVNNFNSVAFTPPVKWTCAAGDTTCDDWTRSERYNIGQGTSIVMVQVYYKWPVIMTFDGFGLGNLPNGKRLMGAAAVFRNEPFT